jgi:uncharacterized protein (DUF608 family)
MRAEMNAFVYRDEKCNQIRFPLGGIGTGSINLAGNGQLVNWEIFNKPNKGSYNGMSHFAIKAERQGTVCDARVLHGDLPPPYAGGGDELYRGFGFGPSRNTMAGMPHFRKTEFTGTFPVAGVQYIDELFPGTVQLTAFNPFIPLNDKDSGIPAAFFEFTVTNSTDEPLDYTIAGVLCNPFPADNIHTVHEFTNGTALHLTSDASKQDEPAYGELTLFTDAEDTSSQLYLYNGSWFDTLEIYWHDLTTPGKFTTPKQRTETAKGKKENHGILAAHITVAPGESRDVRFLISWHVPVCENYWQPDANERAQKERIPLTWKNYYATVWENALANGRYAMEHWDRLWQETLAFKDTMFRSTVPPAVLDAVSANISILKSPTVLRLEDGTFYGWEGCHCRSGCCEGSCTHVWNYAQALPFLFPKLERTMREADYRYNQQEDGGMPFRLQLPLGVSPWSFRSCADGLFGGVMKTYRDWKICGDTQWLKQIWPAVKKSIEYTWADTNADRWDPDKTGVLHGRQHHTLDMELFGPNSWLTGFYLGALKAGAEMAEAAGDTAAAREYRELFGKGRAWVDEHLFNGEYFYQWVNLKDKSLLESFDAVDSYWNEEAGEIKYQVGEGSVIDQVLAQWHADLYGLGDIFDRQKVRTALESMFKYNFRESMRDYPNPCRIFCINDESGMVICAWPENAERPAIPVPYSQETMHGYEYAAAELMINRGMIDEGVRVVKGVRDRYDGEKRNPWNEIECGSNYARSMASYALLNVLSGFVFDLAKNMIGFNPVLPPPFKVFWSLDTGWGEFTMAEDDIKLTVLYGSLTLSRFVNEGIEEGKKYVVMLDETPVSCEVHSGEIVFTEPVEIQAGCVLSIKEN